MDDTSAANVNSNEDIFGPHYEKPHGGNPPEGAKGVYHPTGRVLTVLELLQSRPGLTGPEIAARLETDVRTVRRYIAKLQDVGIPVRSSAGRNGGYSLKPGYKLPPLIFDQHEATAIVLGLLVSPWLEIAQSPAAVEGALSKITRVLPQAARRRVQAMTSIMILSSTDETSRPNASLLLLLSDSVEQHTCVEMDYVAEDGASTHRVVEPCGLVGRKGRWYLVGFCRLRTDYRVFRIDRIGKAKSLQESFTPKPGFDFRAHAVQYLENLNAPWLVRVAFQAPIKQVRERIPASLGTLKQALSGAKLEWRVNDLYCAARYLMERGIPFLIEDPPELRAELKRLASEANRIADAS
jgi:predicted DNA-binding transcriptional regulator YafY